VSLHGLLGDSVTFLLSPTSALDGGEWSAPHPDRFAPIEIAAHNHWLGGWEGPKTVCKAWRREKSIPC
jgi:hypothetical protein